MAAAAHDGAGQSAGTGYRSAAVHPLGATRNPCARVLARNRRRVCHGSQAAVGSGRAASWDLRGRCGPGADRFDAVILPRERRQLVERRAARDAVLPAGAPRRRGIALCTAGAAPEDRRPGRLDRVRRGRDRPAVGKLRRSRSRPYRTALQIHSRARRPSLCRP